MQIAIIGAGFTPEEADRLRRSLATFKNVGTIHTFRERFLAGHGGERLRRATSPSAASRQIEGFGSYGFPESHAASFALPRLRLGLAQVPPPGGLRLRAAQLAADGLLRPGADRARRPRARGRGAAGLRQRQLLGQRARARRPRRAGAPPRLPPDQGHAPRTRPTGSPRPAATATATSARSGAGPGRRRGCWRRLAEADAFAALGLDRRDGALAGARRSAATAPLPLFAGHRGRGGGRPGAAAADDPRRGDRRRLYRAAPDAPRASDGAAPPAARRPLRREARAA